MSIIKTIVCASSFGFFSSLALLPLSSQVHAISELEQGFQAQSKSDLTSAANYFLTAAQAGSSEAQYQLGLLYVQGIGIDSDMGSKGSRKEARSSEGSRTASERSSDS